MKDKFINMDFSEIEKRVLSMQALINIDPYKHKAGTMFNVPYNEVTPAQRLIAKQEVYRQCYTPQDGPSYEDGPWAKGWLQRSTPKKELLLPHPEHNGAIK